MVSLSKTISIYFLSGSGVIKLFPCSTQLSRIIVGILTFISVINTTFEGLKVRNFWSLFCFCFYQQLKFCAQLS